MSMELIISPLSLAAVSFNKAEIAEKILEINSRYAGIAVTDKAAAKADRAEINKILKQIDDARKTIKRQYDAPLKAFEAELKEVVMPLTETRDAIDAAIKVIETREREERYSALEEAYNVSGYSIPFNRVFDPRWLGGSMTTKKAISELMSALESAEADVQIICDWHSPNETALIERYMRGASLKEIADYKVCLDEQARTFVFAGMETPADIVAELEKENPLNTYRVTDAGILVCGKMDTYTITLSCTREQLALIERTLGGLGVFYIVE